ncbi:hypothetical protein [Micromonospora sp. 4G55]|uniref:hypothetical protein n=1 Tax=Micromonospora sp. 4G55 TaxID=2806102 RepID=UPI001A53A0B2|nr:hypothetical protein [Micromonospora sp. 4G55]MBM0257273.1 hypothetical protein [Micromonospora sp. 4G55]
MYEVISALTFDGLTIGARHRRDADGRPQDRDAGWVAFWPADEHRWMIEFARPANENHLYVRFRIGEILQTWPWTDRVQLLDEGWVMAPAQWKPTTDDLRPVSEEVLARLEPVSPSQVSQFRAALQATFDNEGRS